MANIQRQGHPLLGPPILTAMRHGPRLTSMKSKQDPTRILLKDIPLEGQAFEFTNFSGELNDSMGDVVGSNAYRVDLFIQPMGNTYELKGEIKSAVDQQCSVCADEFKRPVSLKVHELIVVERALGKGDQSTKSNHAHEWEQEGPDYIILPSEIFDVGAYAHEAVALTEPIRPLCSPDHPSGCARSLERVERPWLSYGETENREINIRSNPFQVLEKIKLKS